MLRKLGIAGLVAGAAMGAVLSAAPAHADGGHQTNNNLQLIPVQLCNSNILLGIPVFSPQHTHNCTNGPINANVEKHKGHHHGHHGHHHGHHGHHGHHY
ncbi:hypothetical protein CDO52_25395 [Nocardiopsis gilva YIM 90087]|uniref:DUF320 domain-containing protein n=1 Tax=Nocardiopsis gilva YIM 90087 TaxID=1235441 RepID=A0A223SC10_9ACTN|nr:hypothetical protein [Nocardiopsis gilva]ASU85694.1 hypothetical protein CDO52_25395 [Nocardiopsis gilva YIM 90087]